MLENRLENRLIKILYNYNLIRDLRVVQQLHLPNWCIAAGYVRNGVWDYLHGYASPTPLSDVDVLYYDPADLNEDTEKRYDQALKELLPEYNWSCKNQARMHLKNQEEPYLSVEDAMLRWPETATAVGVSMDRYKKINVIAPHGLRDLFDLIIRRSPYCHDEECFRERVRSKNWLEIWPRLRMAESGPGEPGEQGERLKV
ncbi:nucleotidyltransferase family protein [Paenibacillus sp. HN-1]|uniref:nucleotidyltransferase family protein n=1 Tax=Paenibacillus TaxID=44249 RepID=UPI001CA9C5DF|nr:MULTISPECIES: nucleotidyltransferase family protein [Paenibacillus]MBY9077819.1 nucleotidyltransferase family protein [Paenibacillus sp. CGMCC 1.18879]MBY9088225.1 nucleotidyltransferase family protein [Paenibacillus sinensis]